MLSSPFAFYRGAAGIMAGDLATGPRTGLEAQLCGDAHLSNFGGFAAPDRTHVFDINDFDETLPGPFEWDVKRLAASIAIAGRALGFDDGERRSTVRAATRAYREAMRKFATMRNIDVWYARLDIERLFDELAAKASARERKRARAAVAKAEHKDHLRRGSPRCDRIGCDRDARMSIVQVLPLAFVMVAGPQILSAIFFATSDAWRRNSALYILGASLSISIVVTAAFLLGIGASDAGASNDALYFAILALLLFGMWHAFRTRNTAEPPKWMGKLQTASARFCFVLGFLLLGVFPSDLVTSISVGSFLSTRGDPWWHYLPFLALTLLFLAVPSLLVMILGRRAEEFLPRARDWMNANSWIVNELVLLLFVVIVVSNIA